MEIVKYIGDVHIGYMPRLNSICRLILTSDPEMRKFAIFSCSVQLRKFIVEGKIVIPEFIEMIPEYLHDQLYDMVDCDGWDISVYKHRAFMYNLILALGSQECNDELKRMTDFYSCLIYKAIMGETSIEGESIAELLASGAIVTYGEYYGTDIDRWNTALTCGYMSVSKHRLRVDERNV